jgi:hypothetical protein
VAHCQTDSVLISKREYVRALENLRKYKLLQVEHEKIKIQLQNQPKADCDEFKRQVLNLTYDNEKLRSKTTVQSNMINQQRKENESLRLRFHQLDRKFKARSEDERRLMIQTFGVVLGLTVTYVFLERNVF